MQLIQLPWLPSTEVTKTAKHHGYRLSGMALTVMLLSACNSEDGFSSDDEYGLSVSGQNTLIVSQTAQLSAVASHSGDDVTGNITWSSSSPMVVAVNDDGQYEALSTGTATLEGMYDGQVVESRDVEVIEGESITLNVVNATNIQLEAEFDNAAMVVDWGDKTSTEVKDERLYHTYETQSYTGEVTFRAETLPKLSELRVWGAWAFSLSKLNEVAPELEVFEAHDSTEGIIEEGLVSGKLINLPRNLKEVDISDSFGSVLFGSETDLPPTMESVGLGNRTENGLLQFDLTSMSTHLTKLKSLKFHATPNGVGVFTGDLADLQMFADLKRFDVQTTASGLTGELSSLPQGLEQFVLSPTNVDNSHISGSISDIPSSITHLTISNRVTNVTGGIEDLQRQDGFERLNITGSTSIGISSLPKASSHLQVRGDFSGDLNELPNKSMTGALDINGGNFDADLSVFEKEFELSYYITLNTSGDITGDLASVSHLSLWNLNLLSSLGFVTGNIIDVPACKSGFTENGAGRACTVVITTPNSISGDLREFAASRTNLGTLKVDIRGDNTIYLSGREPLEGFNFVKIQGAGMTSESVDNVLIALDGNNLEGGTVWLAGNNYAPSLDGALAALRLEGKGWTVSYTGKP